MPADEFAVIRDLFAPLAGDPAARGLQDDVAVLPAESRLVVTTDAIVEGVHFLPDDPIETVAMKALRANLSDLVAKGARPTHALLTLVWPGARPAAEIARFATALGGDLQRYGVALIGGDTTSTPGPLTVSITAFGAPIGARTPSRSDAQPGEDLWLIGGEIGSAWLGLQLRTGRLKLADLQRGRDEAEARAMSETMAGAMPAYLTLPGEPFDAEAAWLMSAYLAPLVRTECAEIVARFASASMDVSDGLIADARKLASASGVHVRIDAEAVPISIPAQRWAATGGNFLSLLTGGDDYVAMFTAAEADRTTLANLDMAGALRLTRCGGVEPGTGVRLVLPNGADIPLPEEGGHAHALGR